MGNRRKHEGEGCGLCNHITLVQVIRWKLRWRIKKPAEYGQGRKLEQGSELPEMGSPATAFQQTDCEQSLIWGWRAAGDYYLWERPKLNQSPFQHCAPCGGWAEKSPGVGTRGQLLLASPGAAPRKGAAAVPFKREEDCSSLDSLPASLLL